MSASCRKGSTWSRTATGLLIAALPLGALPACCSAPAAKPAAADSDPEARADEGEVGAIGRRPAGPAGISIEEAWEPDRLVLGGGYDLVVITVTRPDPRAETTNASPPRVGITIEEVIGGAAATGPREAVWAPPPHGVDWVGAGSREAIDAWGARPLAGPAAGDRLIVLGREAAGAYRITARLRERFEAARVEHWRQRLASARAEREREAAEREAEARRRAEAEAARLASARPEEVAPRAERIVIATMATLGQSAEGHRVRLTVREALKPAGSAAAELHMILVGAEEEARFVGDGEAIVFLAPRRWAAVMGGELDGLRIVDSRHGVLPATPDLVARTRAALR